MERLTEILYQDSSPSVSNGASWSSYRCVRFNAAKNITGKRCNLFYLGYLREVVHTDKTNARGEQKSSYRRLLLSCTMISHNRTLGTSLSCEDTRLERMQVLDQTRNTRSPDAK